MTTVAPTRIHRRRNYIMLLLFSQMVIAYLDRVNISIAAPAISEYFHWDPPHGLGLFGISVDIYFFPGSERNAGGQFGSRRFPLSRCPCGRRQPVLLVR